MTKRVVVVGAGFAGLSFAIRLARASKKKHREIILLDKKEEFTFSPWLTDFLFASFLDRKRNRIHTEKRISAFDLKELIELQGDLPIHFKKGEVVEVKQDEKALLLANGMTVRYDQLVIAAGLKGESLIKGASLYAKRFSSIEDAVEIRDALVKEMQETEKVREKRRILILGGSAGAYGTALAIQDAWEEMVQQGFVHKGNLEIALAINGEKGQDEVKGLITEQKEKLKKIKVLKGTVVEVQSSQIILKEGDEKKAYDYRLCLQISSGLAADTSRWGKWKRDLQGRLLVGEDFSLKQDEIFAIGDIAKQEGIGVYKGQKPWNAVFSGWQLAALFLEGTKRRTLYKSEIPLFYRVGKRDVRGVFKGMSLKGRLGCAVFRVYGLYYFSQIFPWRDAWRLWLRSLKSYQ